jgi:hypothetical protein
MEPMDHLIRSPAVDICQASLFLGLTSLPERGKESLVVNDDPLRSQDPLREGHTASGTVHSEHTSP